MQTSAAHGHTGEAGAEALRNPHSTWCDPEPAVTPCPLCLPSTVWCLTLAPHTRPSTSTGGPRTRRTAPASSPRWRPAPCPVSVPGCVLPLSQPPGSLPHTHSTITDPSLSACSGLKGDCPVRNHRKGLGDSQSAPEGALQSLGVRRWVRNLAPPLA